MAGKQDSNGNRKLWLAATLFTVINIGLGWLVPLVNDHGRIDTLEKKQEQLEKKIEALSSDNRGDHKDIQEKIGELNTKVTEVCTDVKHLLRQVQDKKYAVGFDGE